MDIQPLECLRQLLETATSLQDRRTILDHFGELLSPSKEINNKMLSANKKERKRMRKTAFCQVEKDCFDAGSVMPEDSPVLYARRISCCDPKKNNSRVFSPRDRDFSSTLDFKKEEQERILQEMFDSIPLLDDLFSDGSEFYDSSKSCYSALSSQENADQEQAILDKAGAPPKEELKANIANWLKAQPQSATGTEEGNWKEKIMMDGSLGWDPRFYAEIVPSGLAFCRDVWGDLKVEKARKTRANRFAVLDCWRNGMYTAEGMKHDIE